MTKRGEKHRVDTRGVNRLELQLEQYVVNEYDNDFGIDFEVNFTDDPDDDGYREITGKHCFIQLKSSTGFKNEDSVHIDLNTTHLTDYLEKPIPVILAIYDDEREEIYWRAVQEFVWDELLHENKTWREQSTVRIRINRSQKLTDYDRLERAVQRTQNRIVRHRSRNMDIGEGINFTPDDFTELEQQRRNDRLSYRGLTLMKARNHLKRGNFDEADKEIHEIINSQHTDEATVKALFVEILRRNPADGDEAIEIAELAHEAKELAADLEMETDELIATVNMHVGGLFVILSKRREMVFTDTVQEVGEHSVKDYEYLRGMESREMLTNELHATGEINRTLATLLENEQYYAYAVCLPRILDYISSRIIVEALSPREDPIDLEEHPLVDQAIQLADYIPDPETEFNLRKSVGVYHYHAENHGKAKEHLTDAHELAKELDDIVLIEDTDYLIERIEEQPDPFETPESDEAEDLGLEELTREALQLQGYEVDPDYDPEEGPYDPMQTAIQYGIEDADPEEYYRYCEHLHLAYEPSYLGRLTNATSIGIKTLWCQYGGGMMGPSLTRLFDEFKHEYCDGCPHHCPRSDGWECTAEFAEEQANDPDFVSFLESRDDFFTAP
ncbi:DUF4365 domain-containing protein [Natronolimnobius sp. AArcel1]|uniref:DUF4365 domain-containing protein n=1 Tax=Natronolimnobius sp. AArcel1 TaxID=1679093 RepID=UPI0013EC5609|nr:DUF4365 domain-containing protein [Natronolimnobius sp. AArcel1]NGM70272.1 DUF4365 domain-containing protein [Natronolimnobius sp. AArcel1]